MLPPATLNANDFHYPEAAALRNCSPCSQDHGWTNQEAFKIDSSDGLIFPNSTEGRLSGHFYPWFLLTHSRDSRLPPSCCRASSWAFAGARATLARGPCQETGGAASSVVEATRTSPRSIAEAAKEAPLRVHRFWEFDVLIAGYTLGVRT